MNELGGYLVVEMDSEREAAYILDRIIVLSHGRRLFNYPVHPYLLLSDIALVACGLYAVVFARHFPGTSALALGAAVLASLIIYKLVLELRARYGGLASRSFLRDGLTVIAPGFLLTTHLLQQPLVAACAFLGMLLPLYGCFARIGCFLGGCCYGRPSRFGVHYPDSVFLPAIPAWRRFTPSPNPVKRVFPVQLLESAGQVFIFSALAGSMLSGNLAPTKILPASLASYCVLRFILDFWRTVSTRPRYGIFSEAQILSLAIAMSIIIYSLFRD
jgi:phosphatidylglycerol:prolipoprotein diacylglycerol transferase